MSSFFIDRPIFAWVIAIIIMMAGAIAIVQLPVAQFPSLAPVGVGITVTYPGASAETAQSTVVQPIEQQLSGLDNLVYFSSESDKDGSITINLSFAQGTDANIAQVQVQNKLQLAMPRLPLAVQQQGVRVAKSTRNFLMVVGLVSTDGSMKSIDIADFIASTVQDPLSRTTGVGDYQLFGAQYAMRIWLDPGKLTNYGLTPTDVSTAIQEQNVQVASGELGGLPAGADQQLNATVIGPSYLQTPEQFGNILLRVQTDGSQVRLKDVARVAFGGENYSVTQKYNGSPASGLAIRLEAGANALETIKAIKATMASLEPTFPPGLQVVYPLDTAPFVNQSVKDVVTTLAEAIGLVFLIMFLFLQSLRATFIPTIAVPVVLLGTCAVLWAAGYSINSLTMFGMVLAIGLLVDDAIVVVENVERVMEEEDGLSPREATRKSMGQISGALVGIALVLSAVFLPMAFFGGSIGAIYRQFSMTIITSMVLSVLVALIFTPALCATILKRPEKAGHQKRGFFGWFNRTFDKNADRYGRAVGGIVRRPKTALIVFAVITAIMVVCFLRIPSGYLPDEDQGILYVQVAAPPGSTQSHVIKVLDDVADYLRKDEAASVEGVLEIQGFSFGGRGQNAGLCFVKLKEWDKRPGAENRVKAIAGRAMKHFSQIKEATVFAFPPPAALELGNANGFDFELKDLAGLGHAKLVAARNQLLGLAAKDPTLAAVRPNGLDDEPQFKIEIDRERASALGISIASINQTISSAFGASYVNDFVDRGRVKRVYLQGQVDSRMQPEDLAKWYVRNGTNEMVPFTAFARGVWGYGSPKLERYNGVPAAEILGAPAPGQSSGAAITAMEKLAAQLPAGISYEWTGLSYEEVKAGSLAILLYGLSLVVVFLCLAALYESWTIPTAVLLVVPLGVFGAVMATLLRGLDNDVYFQVGLLTTIGLSAKNAILIVEFAKENYDRGQDLAKSARDAARQRLRPILMTSFAFVLGVFPLAISSGAGSGGQNAIGTGVVGGMLSATLLAIFFVPMFFVTVLSLFKVKPRRPAGSPVQADPHPSAVTEPGE